jgi:uncharacterized protein (DUF1330 family)
MFKTMVANAVTALIPFGGHVLIDSENPGSLDGVAPQRLLLVAFDSLEKVQAWKDSESFKAFDVDRRRVTTSRVFVVEGTLDGVPGLYSRGRFMRFDPKPFEEIIRKRDEDLNRIKDICKGC